MKNSKVCSSPCFEKSTIKTQLNLELGWLAYINDDVIGDLVYSEQQQKIISENNIDLTLNSPDHLDYETPSRLIKIAACKFMGVFLEKRARDQQEISSELILPNWMNQDLSNLFGEDYKEYRSIDLAYFYSLLPALHNEIASNSIETEFQDCAKNNIPNPLEEICRTRSLQKWNSHTHALLLGRTSYNKTGTSSKSYRIINIFNKGI